MASPSKVWTVPVLMHIAADSAEDALQRIEDALLEDGPVVVTRTPSNRSIRFVYMNLPVDVSDVEHSYDLSDLESK